MFDLMITDLSKTKEEGNVDFITLENGQWAMIKKNIELLKEHEKCELMYVEDFQKTIEKAQINIIEQFVTYYKLNACPPNRDNCECTSEEYACLGCMAKHFKNTRIKEKKNDN